MPLRPGAGPLPYWRLSGFYFFYFALLGGLYPYWPLYLRGLGFAPEQIGALLAIPLVTKVVAPNLWGWLGDRSGRRLGIIRLGSLLALLCFLGIFVGNSLLWLALVLSGYSFFWNAVLPQHEVITLGFLGAQPERYSRIRLWGSIGFIAAVIGVGFWLETWGIRWFPVAGSLLLATILASSLLIPRPAAMVRERVRQPLHAAARQPAVLAFLAAGLLLQVAHGAYYSFISIHLEALGYGRTAIGVLWSVGVVAEILVFAVMHRVLLRFGVRTLLLASLSLAALRWWLIGHWSQTPWLLVAAQSLHAFSFGTFHASGVETIRRLFGPAAQGSGQALYGAVSFGLGGAVGSWAAGRFWHLGAAAVFDAAALACVLAALIAWYGFRDPRLRD